MQALTDLGCGVTYRWLDDHKIVNFQLNNVTREAIDVWITELDRLSATWDVTRPWLAMHEISQLPLTPYTRKRTEEMITKYPQIYGRIAVVLRPSIFTHVIRLFSEIELRKKNNIKVTRVFTSREAALIWLREMI